jgi:hypothetical protein
LNVALNAGQEKKEATFGMIFWHLLYLLGFFLVNNAYMYDYVCVYVYMNSGQVVLVANAPPLDYSFKAGESSTAVKRFENPWINLERNYAAVSSLRQRTMHNFFEIPYTRTSSQEIPWVLQCFCNLRSRGVASSRDLQGRERRSGDFHGAPCLLQSQCIK